MALWVVRAGKTGDRETECLEQQICAIGWPDLDDLSKYSTKDELHKKMEATYSNFGPKKVINHLGQLWAFSKKIQVGDIVVLPLKKQAAIAIGKVTSDYKHNSNAKPGLNHYRSVDWVRTDIPRTAFNQDLLYSFGAFMTVCQIKRNNAEQRVLEILKGKEDPKLSGIKNEQINYPEEIDDEDTSSIDLEQAIKDEIVTFIKQESASDGYKFSNLVNAVLQAQGYTTHESSPGPDGGVDILAGSGPMGFSPPRMVVQVKATSSPVDVKVYRELMGIMQNYGADLGLLVSWGGFKGSVLKESLTNFFKIRLWDQGSLINELLKVYDKLPEDFRAELPLKRVWLLVSEE